MGTLGRALEERFDASGVLLLSSGTHALQLAMGMLPEGRAGGRIVALPGYGCYDLVTAAVGAGVQVRLYDVDPVTLSPDLDHLRTIVGRGVCGIVAANLYGYPLDWPGIRSVANSAGVPVIEDAAQGLGTTTPLGCGGSIGDLTVLSFGRGKGWTGGGGGALLARSGPSPAEYGLLARMRAAGESLDRPSPNPRAALVTLATWLLGRPGLFAIPMAIPRLGLGETMYHEPTAPLLGTSFTAGLVTRTADAALAAPEGRREVAELLREAFERSEARLPGHRSHLIPSPIFGARAASFLRLPLFASSVRSAEWLRMHGRGLGVAAGYPKPLALLGGATGVLVEPGVPSTPGSTELAERMITLPTHRWIRPGDVQKLGGLLGQSVRESSPGRGDL